MMIVINHLEMASLEASRENGGGRLEKVPNFCNMDSGKDIRFSIKPNRYVQFRLVNVEESTRKL